MRWHTRMLLVMVVLMLSFSLMPPLGVEGQTKERCFNETGLCISGRLREFWEQNGGLPVFGLPITSQREESIEGKSFQVQWFERNRLELHPENARPYDVLLGRLGVDRLAKQGRDWFTFSKSDPQANCRFFPETGHNVCGEILTAWRASGLELDGRRGKGEAENLALFGLPLSDAQSEVIEGKEYTVQWFERARFELHPENAPPYNVLLGLLGTEVNGPPLAPFSLADAARLCEASYAATPNGEAPKLPLLTMFQYVSSRQLWSRSAGYAFPEYEARTEREVETIVCINRTAVATAKYTDGATGFTIRDDVRLVRRSDGVVLQSKIIFGASPPFVKNRPGNIVGDEPSPVQLQNWLKSLLQPA